MQEASCYPSQNNNSTAGNHDETQTTLVGQLVDQANQLSYEDQLQRLNKFHSERLAQNLLNISKKKR
jgi:sulfate adenylyltransferase subunit 1 (EFTu-like GTPase family)